MKIKTLVVCLLAACFATESAFAQITATSDATNDSITISGTISQDEAQVVLLKPGFDISDAETAAISADKSELGAVIEYFGQATAKNKNIDMLIPMRADAEKGKYLLIVGSDASEIYYATLAERVGNMIPAAKTALTTSSFDQFVESDGKYFCDSDLFESLENSENVSKYAAEILDEFKNLDDSEFMPKLSSAMNMGVVMEALNENKISDIETIKSMTDDTDMIVPFEKIDLIKADKVANIISNVSRKNFATAADYQKQLSEGIFMNAIFYAANMSNENKKEFFEQYAAQLGLNLTNYVKLNANRRTEAIVNLLATKNTSFSALQSSLDSVCKRLAVNYVEGNDNGGGAGGGGGGSPSPSGIGVGDVRATFANKTIAAGSGLTDLAECQWAKPAIDYLVGISMISGYGDNTFKPTKNITRAEFISIIARKYLPQDYYEQSFADVDNGSWYFNYVESAYNSGIISGKDGNVFAPNDNITRQDMAVILYSLAKFLGHELPADAAEFADDADIAEYSRNAIYSLRCAGIVNGDEKGSFNPKAAATRAEAAQMIYSLIKSFE